MEDVLKEAADIWRLVPIAATILEQDPDRVIDDPRVGRVLSPLIVRAWESGELTHESLAREILYLPRPERVTLIAEVIRKRISREWK